LTYVAAVVEVEVSDQGDIKIPRVDYVVDAGRVANPEVTRASSKAQRCLDQCRSQWRDYRQERG